VQQETTTLVPETHTRQINVIRPVVPVPYPVPVPVAVPVTHCGQVIQSSC